MCIVCTTHIIVVAIERKKNEVFIFITLRNTEYIYSLTSFELRALHFIDLIWPHTAHKRHST